MVPLRAAHRRHEAQSDQETVFNGATPKSHVSDRFWTHCEGNRHMQCINLTSRGRLRDPVLVASSDSKNHMREKSSQLHAQIQELQSQQSNVSSLSGGNDDHFSMDKPGKVKNSASSFIVHETQFTNTSRSARRIAHERIRILHA